MRETRAAAGLFKRFAGGERGGGVKNWEIKLSCVSFGGQFVRRIIEARKRFESSDYSDHACERPIISFCGDS